MKKAKRYLRRKLLCMLIILGLFTSMIPTDIILADSSSTPTIQKYTYSYVGTDQVYTVSNIKKGYKINWSLSEEAKNYISFHKERPVYTKEVTVKGPTARQSVYTLAAAKAAVNQSYKVTAVIYDTKGKKIATLTDKVRISIDSTDIQISNPPEYHRITLGTSYNFNRTILPSNTSNKTFWVVSDSEDNEILNTKTGKTSKIASIKMNGFFTPKVAGTYKITAIAYRDQADTIQRSISKVLEVTVVSPLSSVTPVPTPAASQTAYVPPVNNPPVATPIPATPTPMPVVPDTDGDGVLDDDELLYGTSKDKQDTDGDTLSDFIELFVLFTDPLKPEENVEEYKNPEKDTDEDGLSDWSEITEYFTFWNLADSDSDGLKDGAEIKEYKTDPTLYDTDGDGLSDGFEVENGLDPKNPDDKLAKREQKLSNTAINPELLTENIAEPSVFGYIAGDIDEQVALTPSGDITFDDSRSLIGKPVVISGANELFDGTMVLSFDMSDYALIVGNEYLKNLMICKLGADGSYLPVASSVLRGTILSCNPDSAGTYFVLDVAEFLAALGVDIEDYIPAAKASVRRMMSEPEVPSLPSSMNNEEPSESEIMITPYSLEESFVAEVSAASPAAISGQADIAFVIDTTGSMYDEISGVIRNITNFVTILASEYDVQVNFALIDFKDLEEDGSDTTKVIKNGASNWYSKVSDFITKLNTLRATGGGDEAESDIDALETARRLDWRSTASKFAILITDAPYKTHTSYGEISMEEEAARLDADGIITSVISYPGEYTGEYDYSALWKTTDGLFASIYDNFSSILLTLAGMIGEETSDGVWVILKHGYRYIKLPALPENNATDSDGDGVSDYNELGSAEHVNLTLFLKALLIARGVPAEDILGETSIIVYNALSDPTMPDTDGDGMNDGIDPKPWIYDAIPPITENTSGTAYVQAQWQELSPIFINTGARSKSTYDTILNQFDVENNIRYKKDTRNGAAAAGYTWCNIFVWDATIGMKVEIPHFYNPKTGAKATSLKAGEYYEMSASRMTEWLNKFGATYGWHEVSASEAQAKANAGLPTVAVATDTNHVQMICPSRGEDTGTMAAQAGAVNYRYGLYTNGMGRYNVKFYCHD